MEEFMDMTLKDGSTALSFQSSRICFEAGGCGPSPNEESQTPGEPRNST